MCVRKSERQHKRKQRGAKEGARKRRKRRKKRTGVTPKVSLKTVAAIGSARGGAPQDVVVRVVEAGPIV
jgi:hypothetical protein